MVAADRGLAEEMTMRRNFWLWLYRMSARKLAGEPITFRRRPTIEELERILDSADNAEIIVLADGQVRAV